MNNILETLGAVRFYTTRIETLPPNFMAEQIEGVKDLVGAMHAQLEGNAIDRDVTRKDISPKFHTYDAFFRVGDDAVVKITSIGSPDQRSKSGLFLYIYGKNNEQLVGLQTAKISELVDENEALWLSRYTPKQLHELAQILRNAESISYENYQSFADNR